MKVRKLRIGPLYLMLLVCSVGLASYAKTISKEPSKVASPIELMARRLNALKDGGLWQNGLSPNLYLPATAKVEDILKAYFKALASEQLPERTYTILDHGKVRINDRDFVGAFVKRAEGERIIFMRHNGADWYTKELAWTESLSDDEALRVARRLLYPAEPKSKDIKIVQHEDTILVTFGPVADPRGSRRDDFEFQVVIQRQTGEWIRTIGAR